MKIFTLIFSLLLATAGANAAHARDSALHQEDFSVDVPRSEVDVHSQIPIKGVDRDTDYQVSISTWAPSNYTRPSFFPDVTKFQHGGVPLLGFSRVAPLASAYRNGARFYWRVGLAYAQLERQGLATAAGVPFTATQALHLIGVRAGVEYRGLQLAGGILQPYVNASLVPLYALSPITPFERQVNDLGLGYEVGAGLILHPPFLRDLFGLGDAGFGLGAHYLFGTINGSNLAGLGAQGLLQLTL